MNGKELFESMTHVHSKYILEADALPEAQPRPRRLVLKKSALIAAVLGLMVLLMGSTVIIRTVLAESDLFDYPLVDTALVPPENIHLTVDQVGTTSMHVYCDIEGVEYGKNSIYILANGPFAIEKQTENGWEALPSNIDDPTWDADEILTDGTTDWYVNWSAMYGILEPGTYRYVATVLEGNVPVSVEFTVEGEESSDLQAAVQGILNGEAYHIRYTTWYEFGSMENLTKDGRDFVEHETATYTYEYVKSGEDMLYLCYREDILWTGMMYENGIKYQLDHEGDDRTNPVIGWSPWPDMDLNDLTSWIGTLTSRLVESNVENNTNGSISRIVYTEKGDTFNSYKIEYTRYQTWEIITTDPIEAAAKLAQQDVDTAREFSWEDDRKNMKALEVEFVNTDAQPVSSASEAIARAMAECTVEHDKILCYRDEEAGMWKVEFQIMYGYQGYQFIYLNDDGITQMVSGAGSKVPEWKDLYPDP